MNGVSGWLGTSRWIGTKSIAPGCGNVITCTGHKNINARAAAVIKFYRSDGSQQHLLVIGKLLERPNLAAGPNDRDQVIRLNFFIHKLAQRIPDLVHALG